MGAFSHRAANEKSHRDLEDDPTVSAPNADAPDPEPVTFIDKTDNFPDSEPESEESNAKKGKGLDS